MRIAVDLRLLNYKHITGVGIYCLHLLEQLGELKKTKNVNITAIGLKPEIYEILAEKYKFLDGLFDQNISLKEYLGLKFHFGSKWINLLLLAWFRVSSNYYSSEALEFDYLILPQPRLINIHPNTSVISIFHDLYSILHRQNLSISQKILENKFNYNLVAKLSDQIWCDSIATCIDVTENLGVNSNKIKLVYPGLPQFDELEKTQNNKLNQLPEKPFLLAISGIEPRKNWYNLLLAHQYLQQNYDDYSLELVFAGRPVNQKYYNSLTKLVDDLQIKNVTWYFDVDEDFKQELLQNCEIFVYPSLYEGFGFPILEAFKYNKPVITSRISSMPEIAKDSAFYINPLNFMDIARGIYLIYKDNWLKSQITADVSKRVKEFSWGELYNRLEKLLGGK